LDETKRRPPGSGPEAERQEDCGARGRAARAGGWGPGRQGWQEAAPPAAAGAGGRRAGAEVEGWGW